MRYFSEVEYKGQLKAEVDRMLGTVIVVAIQFNKEIVGSNLYKIIRTQLSGDIKQWEELNVRANFEKYPKGLLLRINHQHKLSFIAIGHDEIKGITIQKGDEKITPLPFGIMYCLLKLGVQVRYARYFNFRGWEYSIERMRLQIKGESDFLLLDSNGFNYYGERTYFKKFSSHMKRYL